MTDILAELIRRSTSDLPSDVEAALLAVEPATGGLRADIRTKATDAGTSVADPKPVDADGKVGLLVTDEDLEGTSVSVVLLDEHERVLVKKPTTVGGEDQ